MDISGQIVMWVAYGMAFYILGVTVFLVANIAIGAVRVKSALWWYLVYSVVVIGMMLIGLLYLPSMVLQYTNDGIEAAQPEIERFTTNIQGMFNTAIGDPVARGQASPQPSPVTPPPNVAIPTIGDDVNSGGGRPMDIATTAVPPASHTPSPSATISTTHPDLQKEAQGRLATVQAVISPTPDLLNPPTPVIHGGGS